MTEENFSLIWTSFIGQFVYSEGEEELSKGVWMRGIVSCEYYFIRVQKIWCNVQIIIYRLLQVRIVSDGQNMKAPDILSFSSWLQLLQSIAVFGRIIQFTLFNYNDQKNLGIT